MKFNKLAHLINRVTDLKLKKELFKESSGLLTHTLRLLDHIKDQNAIIQKLEKILESCEEFIKLSGKDKR